MATSPAHSACCCGYKSEPLSAPTELSGRPLIPYSSQQPTEVRISFQERDSKTTSTKYTGRLVSVRQAPQDVNKSNIQQRSFLCSRVSHKRESPEPTTSTPQHVTLGKEHALSGSCFLLFFSLPRGHFFIAFRDRETLMPERNLVTSCKRPDWESNLQPLGHRRAPTN